MVKRCVSLLLYILLYSRGFLQMKVSLIFIVCSINLFNIFLIYIFWQFPSRYNLLEGGSFLKLLLLKKLYLKKYTTDQMNRKIPPPLDKAYVKKKTTTISNKGNNKITELRTILQRESQNS